MYFTILAIKTAPIQCVIATSNSKIGCSLGVDEIIDCHFEPRLSRMSKLKVNLSDLALLEYIDDNIEFLNLVSTKTTSKVADFLAKSGVPYIRFTFIHPSTLEPYLIAIYTDDTLDVPGFLVTDRSCFNSLVGVVRSVRGGDVRVKLLIE